MNQIAIVINHGIYWLQVVPCVILHYIAVCCLYFLRAVPGVPI